MNKKLDILYAILALSMLCCIVSAFLLLFGIVNISYTGFGVDSNGRVYVGRGHRIEVWDANQLLYTVQNHTSRGYVFSIQDDTILLSTGSTVYSMDLHGKELSRSKDINARVSHQLEKDKFAPVVVNDDQYTISYVLGFLQIYQNEEIIYCMPILDYAIKVLSAVNNPLLIFDIFMIQRMRHNQHWG